MKKYLTHRFKNYIFVIFGLIIGFIISALLLDTPDYTTAIIAVLFGLTIGELFVFMNWIKEGNQN